MDRTASSAPGSAPVAFRDPIINDAPKALEITAYAIGNAACTLDVIGQALFDAVPGAGMSTLSGIYCALDLTIQTLRQHVNALHCIHETLVGKDAA